MLDLSKILPARQNISKITLKTEPTLNKSNNLETITTNIGVGEMDRTDGEKIIDSVIIHKEDTKE